MDQRFWGDVVHSVGVGPPPVHVEQFADTCVAFADAALDPSSEYSKKAAALQLGQAGDDGVATNVKAFERVLKAGRGAVE